MLDLNPAIDRDLDEGEAILECEGLPTADVRSENVQLYLARVDGELVGVGGLEVYGSAALLRSVVVVPSARGEEYGSSLVRALEERAVSLDVDDVYLLTTTAADFFRKLDYEKIDRSDAPSPIRETTQFATLCPDSATCMRKRVE